MADENGTLDLDLLIDEDALKAQRAAKAAYMKAWAKTPKGRESVMASKDKKYKTEKKRREGPGKEYYRAYQKAYNATARGKEVAARKSAKWREAHPEEWVAARAKYFATEKGRVYKWSNSASARCRKTDQLRKDGRTQQRIGGTMTAKQLRDLWYAQDGLCALTGRQLVIIDGKVSLNSCSMDRIDPSLPYILGNVRLVTYQANAAKLFGTDASLIEFCRDIIRHSAGQVHGGTSDATRGEPEPDGAVAGGDAPDFPELGCLDPENLCAR